MKDCFKVHCVICDHQVQIELEADEHFQIHHCPQHPDRVLVPLNENRSNRDYLLGIDLDQKYLLIDVLGKGQFAKVYYAIQKGAFHLMKPVAVKVLNEDRQELEKLFLDEAKIIAKLKSEHIVKYIDSGRDEKHKLCYIVMSLIEGETLSKALKREVQFHAADALHLIDQVLIALEEAHELGIIHRDLKPSNLMLEIQDGKTVLKVLDFGVARPNANRQREETQGMIPGTPAYMAPELFKQYDGSVHPRLDLFSVGVILYQLICGYLPYQCEEGTDSIIAYYRLYHKKPKPLPLPKSVGAHVQQLIHQAIHIDPKKRIQSAKQFRQMLADVLKMEMNLLNHQRSIQEMGNHGDDFLGEINGIGGRHGMMGIDGEMSEVDEVFFSKQRLIWLITAGLIGVLIGLGAHFFG
jgi:serine/threonine protein kinase